MRPMGSCRLLLGVSCLRAEVDETRGGGAAADYVETRALAAETGGLEVRMEVA